MKNDLQVVLSDKGWLGNWAAYQRSSAVGSRRPRVRRAQRVAADLVPAAHAFNGWTAQAEVKGRTVEGEVFTSDATARLDLPDCSMEDADEDEPPPPSVPGVPAEPVTRTIDCGGLKVDVEVDKDKPGPPTFDLPDSFIAQLIGES